MKRFIPKFSEPSTWAGIGLLVAGAGQVWQINEAAPVAEAVAGLGHNPTWQGAAMALMGLAAVFLREKGQK